jgi:hypothetical protein
MGKSKNTDKRGKFKDFKKPKKHSHKPNKGSQYYDIPLRELLPLRDRDLES